MTQHLEKETESNDDISGTLLMDGEDDDDEEKQQKQQHPRRRQRRSQQNDKAAVEGTKAISHELGSSPRPRRISSNEHSRLSKFVPATRRRKNNDIDAFKKINNVC